MVRLVATLMVLLSLGMSESASAATLKADYQLQGNYVSEISGAPELTNIGAGNAFATETIGGIERQVLTFPVGGGLALPTAGLVDPHSHSVAVVFRLSELSGYRRILDFSNGTLDEGLYNLSGEVNLYGAGGFSLRPVFDGSYALLVYTNAVDAGGMQSPVVYVNGLEAASREIEVPFEGFDLESGVLRLFADNTSGPATGEQSAGAVGCILVYDGAFTAQEVSQMFAGPPACRLPEPPKAISLKAPKAKRVKRRVTIDTGLMVSCPADGEACAAAGSVKIVPRSRRATAARVSQLGKVKLSIPPGASARLRVRLSKPGLRALRKAGRLPISASAEIAVAGRKATAQRVGSIEAVGPYAFKIGAYMGATSQGLPILLKVDDKALRWVYFSWRVRCGDGTARIDSVTLSGERLRRGRFSVTRALGSGGSARASGRISGIAASGALLPRSTRAQGKGCAAGKIRWKARALGINPGR